MISVVGTQNDWVLPGISELANSKRDFGDNICPVTDRYMQACIKEAILLIVPPITVTTFTGTLGHCKEMPFCIQK